jgi:hypothetical protein
VKYARYFDGAFKNKALRKIFGHETHEVRRELMLHNEKLTQLMQGVCVV